MNTEIKIPKPFKPRKPTLVVGLPGIAYIGKLSVDYLISQLKAKQVGEVYSRYFPPYVIIKEDGLVELLRNELHFSREGTKRDIVFLSGNAQAFSPEGQYEVAEAFLDWGIENGAKRVYSVAALVTDRQFDVPNVYATATSPQLLEEAKANGALALDHGMIGGENGLVIGVARKKGLEAICLLAETHGYQAPTGEYVIDPRAAKAALGVLTKILGLQVDMAPMEKQAMEMDEAFAKMAEIERRVREEMSQSSKRPSYVT